MKNVEFFDWKLNLEYPVSWYISESRGGDGLHSSDVHSALHLLLVVEGEFSAQYGNAVLNFSAGELFITAPWEVHCTTGTLARKLLVLNIAPEALQRFFFCGYENLEKLFAMPPAERKKCLNFDHDLSAESQKLISLFEEDDSIHKSLLMWHTALGLLMNIKIDKDLDPAQNKLIKQLRPALQKLSGKVLTVNEAAQACNLSSSYFAALFKKSFGLSFANYERMFRLNGAAGELERGATLKEAAGNWGFCDKSHLARLLKKRKREK